MPFKIIFLFTTGFFFMKEYAPSGLKLRERNEYLIFLFLNQNKCCGYSKEPSHWDGYFEHPKHIFKLRGKKIFTILLWKVLYI